VPFWPALTTVAGVLALPVLIGTGAALKAKSDVSTLYATASALEIENANYRVATEALSGQIQGLQSAIAELGAKAALDPAMQAAMDKLPAVVKNRAMGGAPAPQQLGALPALQRARRRDTVDLAGTRLAVVARRRAARSDHRRE
jgi:hypothetical protein